MLAIAFSEQMLISYFSCQQQDPKHIKVAGTMLHGCGSEDQLAPGYCTGKCKPASLTHISAAFCVLPITRAQCFPCYPDRKTQAINVCLKFICQ